MARVRTALRNRLSTHHLGELMKIVAAGLDLATFDYRTTINYFLNSKARRGVHRDLNYAN